MIPTTSRTSSSWTRHLESGAHGLLFFGLFALAFVRLLPGINPHTLYLDDQWVAALAKAPFAHSLGTRVPIPIGFALLNHASLTLGLDPEIALQVIPVAFYLGSFVLLGLVVHQLTLSSGAALLAVYFLAANHQLGIHALRVKHYSADVFCILLLILLSLRYLTKPSIGRLALLGATAAIAFTLSFISVLVSGIAVPLCLLFTRRRRQHGLGAGAAVCALSLLAIAAQYGFIVSPRTPSTVDEFWKGFYLPTSSWRDWKGRFQLYGRGIMMQSLPPGFFRIAYAIPYSLLLGIVVHPRSRFVGLAVIGTSISYLAASTLGFLPFGGGRTDLFLVPLLLLALFLGLTALRRLAETSRRIVSVGLAVLTAGLAVFKEAPAVGYMNDGTQKGAVEYVAQSAGADDCVIVFPDAMWLTGFYSPWPYHLVETERVNNGFDVVIDRPRTLSIASGREMTMYFEDTGLLRAQVDGFFNRETCQRVFHISAIYDPANHTLVNELVIGNGYGRPVTRDFKGATVDIFERAP